MPKSTNPLLHSSTVHPHCRLRFCGGVFLTLAWLALSAAQAQTTNYALGTSALLVGPAAGSNSVVLAVAPNSATWTATTNAAWLHLSPPNQSGTGSTNVVFSYDANPGPTRSNTLTIAGQTLTVTQAGSTYVAAGSMTTLVSSGLGSPDGVAVDGAGNVYIADTRSNAIRKWTAANDTVTTLVSSGLDLPAGVAVDGAANVYIADTGNDAIKEWTAASSNVTILVSSGLYLPAGVAVDGAANVYITDTEHNVIKKWTAANSNVTTLASGFANPEGVAVDGAGNVYIADTFHSAIREWTVANSNVTTLVSSGLSSPEGVAVDGAGNVYIADTSHSAIKERTVANGNVTTLVSNGLSYPAGVAVDDAGNVYVADTSDKAIKELPYAFVDPTPKLESQAGGNDSLPAVVPVTANLLAPFTPASDQPWLTISGITNGVVSFSFSASASNRTGYITLLGQAIPVSQGGFTYSLGTLGATALLEGPSAGSGSVVLAVIPAQGAWTNTANAAWLHLSLANQSGTGSTNIVFSYDANLGATRSGTITVAGQTLTVTQAGSTYVAASSVTTLVSTGLNQPQGVALDGAGNVYIANEGNRAIKKWTAANNSVTTLRSWGFPSEPSGVAVDGAGNVYIADFGNKTITEWTAANSNVLTLVSSGLSSPDGVAVDGAGNVYFSDFYNGVIEMWTAANSNVATLVSGLHNATGVAVDSGGNVYLADYGNSAIKKWTAANSNVTALVSSGLDNPGGVAVDGAGNIYIANTFTNEVQEWTAANSNVTTLLSSGLIQPWGVGVDGAGNVYIADTGNNAIKELPYAFVDPTPKSESAAAGNDSLPVVLPATENLLPPFAPTTDQSWLTITGITNDVVSFSFTFNPVSSRTAHITLLGQSIPVTQAGAGVTPPNLTGAQMLGNGILQFAFTNTPGASFTVVSTTNLSLPFTNWTAVGASTEISPGQFQFTSQPATNDPQRFYGVRSP
jgi:DNA-binding beta-propeller fold protein YncE